MPKPQEYYLDGGMSSRQSKLVAIKCLKNLPDDHRFVLIIEDIKNEKFILYTFLGMSYGAAINACSSIVQLIAKGFNISIDKVLRGLFEQNRVLNKVDGEVH